MSASGSSARSATSTDRGRLGPPDDGRAVALLAAALVLAAFAFCARYQLLLLYGDAVAHLHIARRVFDAREPGFRQLGSVWLPLPHLLLLPFVQKMSWWQTGIGGAVPSMASYVAACVGLYRLAACLLSRPMAWLATLFFALNPGLLYLSTTAMTEPLFLAEMIWALVLIAMLARGLAESSPRPGLLPGIALLLAAAVLTRYDGWVLAAACWLLVTWVVLRHVRLQDRMTGLWLLGSAIVVLAPLLWLAYNARQFHDPLDFLRGPYSARAIEARTSPRGAGHYPEYHRPGVAALYYLKAAELGAVVPGATQLLFALSLLGTALLWRRRPGPEVAAATLLWLPLPFYVYSVAYGSVPIFIPVWFPHSWYNKSYGMELLPAFALFTAGAIEAAAGWRPRWRRWLIPGAAMLILANALALLHSHPLVFEEAVENSRTRIAFETTLANWLRMLPPGSTLLMNTSAHVGAVQQAGIPLRQIIDPGDYYAWRSAMTDPASADYVVAFDGDAVAEAVARRPQGLVLEQIICSRGQPCARVYSAGRRR